MDLTPAELTVLGLIVEQPRHGYDLEQVIEARGIRQWTDIGFSSIYYLLAKLEKRDLISSDKAPGRAKSRRVFHATAEGKHTASQSVLSFISELQMVSHPLLVGLSNLPLLSDRDYADALRSRLVQVESRIESVATAEKSQAPLPRPAQEVFAYSLALLEAERSWLADRVGVPHD